MTQFTLTDARAHHCGRMSRMLRAEHLEALARMGIDPHHELRATYESSYIRKAILADGELIAMGGCQGSFMSPYGFVWLAVSRKAHRYPVTLVKIVRQVIDEIMVSKHAITTTILDGDDTSFRFMAFLGFFVDGSPPGMPAVSARGRRRLVRYAKSNPDLRSPDGSGTMVPFLYSRQVAAHENL